jgi:deoxyribonuclease (pyrimidine dimer)
MTRINADIDPKELTRRHLVAELREITMVATSLDRSLKSRGLIGVRKMIPHKFTLNGGHVSFFYNKLEFLRKRFLRLADEMERRGYNPNRDRISYFEGYEKCLYKDWSATEEDNDIVRERIRQRINEKPHLYEDINEEERNRL